MEHARRRAPMLVAEVNKMEATVMSESNETLDAMEMRF
jgi:hypothetical protein